MIAIKNFISFFVNTFISAYKSFNWNSVMHTSFLLRIYFPQSIFFSLMDLPIEMNTMTSLIDVLNFVLFYELLALFITCVQCYRCFLTSLKRFNYLYVKYLCSCCCYKTTLNFFCHFPICCCISLPINMESLLSFTPLAVV